MGKGEDGERRKRRGLRPAPGLRSRAARRDARRGEWPGLPGQRGRGSPLSIDAQQWKELTGASRKFSIPLAEYFDAERITLRVGDLRRRR